MEKTLNHCSECQTQFMQLIGFQQRDGPQEYCESCLNKELKKTALTKTKVRQILKKVVFRIRPVAVVGRVCY